MLRNQLNYKNIYALINKAIKLRRDTTNYKRFADKI